MKKIAQENNYNFFFKKAHPSLYRKKPKKTPKHTLFPPSYGSHLSSKKKNPVLFYLFSELDAQTTLSWSLQRCCHHTNAAIEV